MEPCVGPQVHLSGQDSQCAGTPGLHSGSSSSKELTLETAIHVFMNALCISVQDWLSMQMFGFIEFAKN